MEISIDQEVEQIGIFSDLHAEDDLLSLLINKHPEITNWFCLGDAVDMFAPYWKNFPTLRKIKHYKIHLIKGNHEEAMSKEKYSKYFKDEPELYKFMIGLPFSITIYFNNTPIELFHAGPETTFQFIDPRNKVDQFDDLFKSIKSDLILLGHTHETYIKNSNKTYANPGSLKEDKSYFIITNRMEIIKMKLS